MQQTDNDPMIFDESAQQNASNAAGNRVEISEGR